MFKTTGTTNSFVFIGCTPNYLPYSKCPVDDDIVDEDDIHINRRYKKTKTSTSTVTATVTVPMTGLCAKLVNVTGPCRRRRGSWIEDPIIMTFDDADMDALDAAFSPTSIFRYGKQKFLSTILSI